jgi:magnesium-transporting ATPase (P-type)
MVIENLKDIWKNQQESTIQFSEPELYKMIHKKSASIVKWIFYISIMEFLAFLLLPLLFKDYSEVESRINAQTLLSVVNLLSYGIAIVFIFIFYINYKRISVTDSSKKLMTTILKTRNAVKNYIIVQLSLGAVALVYFLYKVFKSEEFLNKLPEDFNKAILWSIALLVIFLILGFIWLFYKLLYGILLSRLKDNYKELKRNK